MWPAATAGDGVAGTGVVAWTEEAWWEPETSVVAWTKGAWWEPETSVVAWTKGAWTEGVVVGTEGVVVGVGTGAWG